jgi:hypothetical protein
MDRIEKSRENVLASSNSFSQETLKDGLRITNLKISFAVVSFLLLPDFHVSASTMVAWLLNVTSVCAQRLELQIYNLTECFFLPYDEPLRLQGCTVKNDRPLS